MYMDKCKLILTKLSNLCGWFCCVINIPCGPPEKSITLGWTSIWAASLSLAACSDFTPHQFCHWQKTRIFFRWILWMKMEFLPVDLRVFAFVSIIFRIFDYTFSEVTLKLLSSLLCIKHLNTFREVLLWLSKFEWLKIRPDIIWVTFQSPHYLSLSSEIGDKLE